MLNALDDIGLDFFPDIFTAHVRLMNNSLCVTPTVQILTFSLNLGCCATIIAPNPPLHATVNSLLSLDERSRRDAGKKRRATQRNRGKFR